MYNSMHSPSYSFWKIDRPEHILLKQTQNLARIVIPPPPSPEGDKGNVAITFSVCGFVYPCFNMVKVTLKIIKWFVIICRLKAVELVLGSVDEMNQVMCEHEQMLASHDTMSSNDETLRNTHEQLLVSHIRLFHSKLSWSELEEFSN